MRSLDRVLCDPGDPRSVVAWRWDSAARADRAVRWGQFQTHVSGLVETIEKHPEGPWVLLTDDAYAFAVGLFALWHAGRHAISPPNRQPGALRILQTRAIGVLSDRSDWFPEGLCVCPLAHASPLARRELRPLEREVCGLELFTSGTTGAEKPVTKCVRHLADEVQQLEELWGGSVEGATVVSTASHQHLYGLLFGVLWPLCAGRPFHADHLLHAGELVPRMRRPEAFVLASVPTHLRRLARHAGSSMLAGRCRAVFSSGGPLPSTTADQISRVLDCPPIEVLGSSETGGVAWRTQQPGGEEAPWTPFPAVHVTRDPETGVARVRSPFVSVNDAGGGCSMGDRIALHPDGRFRLEGRADRIVKIAEKRIDLSLMESRLRAHDWVAEAALGVLDGAAEPRVVAAVVTTPRGGEQLRRLGRRAFCRALGATLAEEWDLVLHPRLWRVVSRLPENPQGKTTQESLRDLFEETGQPAPFPDRPEVLGEIHGSGFVERSCIVPPDLVCFAGHFPGAPVVPGVLQLDWAMDLVAVSLGEVPRIEEIESLRLRAPLGPGDPFRIRVHAVPEKRVDFRIWSGRTEHAAGRIRLRAAGIDP